MKLDPCWRGYSEYRQYCVRAGCRAAAIERDGDHHFRCAACGHRSERRIVIDPAITWWIGDDGEYWHESAGVFVRDPDRRFLFFERRVHPIGRLTVPAGHLDAGESAVKGARRELREETGIKAPRLGKARRLRHITTDDIAGDSCRRGSDAHRWHAYLLVLRARAEPRLSGEGTAPRWLTLTEALSEDLTHPVRHIITRHRPALESAAPR